MKIQYLAIIFLIIIIPISLVLTIYNQSQINNLNLQLLYKTKLTDATHDAVKVFELNTVNNKYSQEADSLKRDVQASINVFLQSMAKSIGISGATSEAISEYVPAVLCTLYDGYYIYAPVYSEKLKEEEKNIDGKNEMVETKIEGENFDFTHILKPYVYYTMRYVSKDNTDIIVNYSLDNYITIYGKIDGEYVTKSGYLLALNESINNLKDVNVSINQNKLKNLLKRNILIYIPGLDLRGATYEDIDKYYDQYYDELRSTYIVKDSSYRDTLITNMGEALLDKMLNSNEPSAIPDLKLIDIPISKIDEKIAKVDDQIKMSDGVTIDEVIDCIDVEYKAKKGTDNLEINDSDAKAYYAKALKFSIWVNTNLSKIEACDAVDAKNFMPEEFNNNHSKIFKTTVPDNNPEELVSHFAQHKIEVIKSSIQSNLTSSIARYNQNFFGLKHGYDLKMPVLNDLEWEAITKKITFVSFMQGIIIGNKVFNDYSVVSSNENKEFVDVNEIYYFNKNVTGTLEYHRFDCPKLKEEDELENSEIIGYKAINYSIYKTKDEDQQLVYTYSDEIERLKGGKITRILSDYDCLVNCNYTREYINNNETPSDTLNLAKYIAIGSERNKHVKVNAYMDSDKIDYKN